MTRSIVAFMIGIKLLIPVGPSSAQPPASPEPVQTTSIDPINTPPNELKIRLAPLELSELESFQDDLMNTLRVQAAELADLLVQYQRLYKGDDAETSTRKELAALLEAKGEAKAELISRVNIVLAAIDSKGGDTSAVRAFMAALSALRLEKEPLVQQPSELSPKEQAKKATRAMVDELVAAVRAEPPVHERVNPWLVPLAELELELQPLTLDQIGERLGAWQQILQHAVRKRVRYDILLNNADKLKETQTALANVVASPKNDNEALSPDALKGELAELSQAQHEVIRAIVERMNVAIRLMQLRGGDPKPYVDYIASATGQKLNLYDPSVLIAQLRAWLVARDGGIKVGLNILKFLGVLIVFWFLSLVLGWIVSAAVNRVPQASSLLRPLLVTSVRRVTQLVGLVFAITMLGINAGPLLAMIGAAGLVVGLALQSTLSNFASGIMILVNRPYDVGDTISAGGVRGKVEAMNLVSTRILTFDNQSMLVPNNEIWNGVINNITGRSTRRVDLTFGIGYADDVEKAMRALESVISEHPKVLKDPAPIVRVNELGDNSVNIIARPWTRTADYWDVYWDLMRSVKLRFDAEGINIPFPQRDVHFPGPIEVRLTESPKRRDANPNGSDGKQSPPPPAKQPHESGSRSGTRNGGG